MCSVGYKMAELTPEKIEKCIEKLEEKKSFSVIHAERQIDVNAERKGASI